MGASKKNDRRVANYQARQRQDEAKAKAEKDRQKREDCWSQAVVPALQYASGGNSFSSGGYVVSPRIIGQLVSPGLWRIAGWTDDPALKLDLPKSESTEVITALRMWHLKRTFPAGYRLVPLNQDFGEVVPFERLVATCVVGGNHEAPNEACTCGYHAYKASVPLDHQGKPYVAGEVSLWGKVVEHSDGFRAQYAYPKRLYVIDGGPRADKIAEALSWTYGVPCEVWDG